MYVYMEIRLDKLLQESVEIFDGLLYKTFTVKFNLSSFYRILIRISKFSLEK